MPKVSVIIPVYNAEKYLTQCLDSVINQTFKDIEIVCVNDTSKDTSSSILEEFAKKDDRIKIINNEKNLGSALTRNRGIDAAQGEYIYFIDSDDYIDEKYLECMYNAAEKANCDIALNLNVVTESNGVQTKYRHPSMPEIKPEGEYIDKVSMIHDAPCFIWARIYRRDFLNKYNLRFLDIKTTDDVVFNSISSLYTEKTFTFYGETYHYTVAKTSIVGIAKEEDNRDLMHIKAYSLIYDYLKQKSFLNEHLKLFRVYPFFKVNTEEKFNYYKNFFEKIKNDFEANKKIYNDLEKFFLQSIEECENYEEYLKKYNKIITIGFLRQKKVAK